MKSIRCISLCPTLLCAVLVTMPSEFTACSRDHEGDPAVSDHNRERERHLMVDQSIIPRGAKDPAVIAAMRQVPRHRFVPARYSTFAYVDAPLPIGYDQTISQPSLVANMTEELKLKKSDKVLEIGTGSGYQAAILAELVDKVFTVEIVEPLARQADATLSGLGYKNVKIRMGDGYQGWPEEAPFDAIIVTAAPDHVPQPLLDQLAVGGRMIVPVGRGVQTLELYSKTTEGIERKPLTSVRFVPLVHQGEGEM